MLERIRFSSILTLAIPLVLLLVPVLCAAQVVRVPTWRVSGPMFSAWLQDSDVAVGSDGNITFIWWEFNFQNNKRYIVTRQFSPDGVALGPAVRVDSSGRGARPSISRDGRGGYAAVWDKMEDGYDIYGRLLDSAGRASGSEFLIDSNGGVGLAVAGLPSGSVYSWKDYYLMGRMYDQVGVPRAPSFEIGEQSPCFWNAIDSTSDGGFVDVWGNPWTVPLSWAHVYGPDGNALGERIGVSDLFLADRVAGNPLGGFAVVGSGPCAGRQGLWLRRFDEVGIPLDPADIMVSEATSDHPWITPDVAYDPDGNIYVVWNDYSLDTNAYSVPFSRAFDRDGQPLGPTVQISTQPGVEVRTDRLADGCFVNAWYQSAVVYANAVCLCNRSDVACGDGTTTANCEACDDGNFIDGDGCDSDCTVTGCGNGIVTEGEQCDDGNAVSGDGCDSNCTASGCGNGALSEGEECDDGNLLDGDGCDPDCRTACGNGATGPGESCDDGNRVDGDGCDSNCTVTACGNGIASFGEACDDGNTTDGDGCDSNCRSTGCGNGVVTSGEECDDGGRSNSDGCDSSCLVEICGNNRLEGDEECDDGNAADNDYCRNDCTIPAIHDSVVLPVDPMTVELPAGQEPTLRLIEVQVVNADVKPVREQPGHTIELLVTDGTCPAGTIVGEADFERGETGDQNTVLVAGGEPRLALIAISLSRANFSPVCKRAPVRCTLQLRVRSAEEGSLDPTPDNNVVGMELNVADTVDPVDTEFKEFVLSSMKPVTLRIAPGETSVSRQVKPQAINADTGEEDDTGKLITVTAVDGDCPTGTLGLGDFDRRRVGLQNSFRLLPHHRSRGVLGMTVTSAAFRSPSRDSPARCTAILTATSGALEDTDASNNSAQLVIDVIDNNDF